MAGPGEVGRAPQGVAVAPRSRTRLAKGAIDLGLKTYKGAIYAALSEMIGELELAPGERLVEADLVSSFKVSKTPIREAFLRLEADGLVELAPYVGARVNWMSLEQWEEQLFIFDALEQSALPRVAERISTTDTKATRRLVDRLRRNRAEGDSRGYSRTMWEIHQILFASAGLPRLLQLILDLGKINNRRYQRVFIHQFDAAWDIELEVVAGRVEGIAQRDPAAAARVVAEGHRQLLEHAHSVLDDPRVTPYIRPAGAT